MHGGQERFAFQASKWNSYEVRLPLAAKLQQSEKGGRSRPAKIILLNIHIRTETWASNFKYLAEDESRYRIFTSLTYGYLL